MKSVGVLITLLSVINVSISQDANFTITNVEYEPYVNFFDIQDMKGWNVGELSKAIPAERIPDTTVVVFPAYSISSIEVRNDRDLARQFAQEIPNGGQPCIDFGMTVIQGVTKNLSCVAKDNAVYLVANYLELCVAPECSNGEKIYSTSVVFGPDGSILAKYRHVNLMGELGIDAGPSMEAVNFTTQSGVTFGLLSANDLLFEQPATDLIKSGIEKILVPFAWRGLVPFLTPFELQYGWHVSMTSDGTPLDLFSGCYLKPSLGYMGCGDIFSDNGGYTAFYHPNDACSYGEYCSQTASGTVNITSTKKVSSRALGAELQYPGYNMENFTSQPLEKTANTPLTVQACDNNLCCKVEYQLRVVPTGDMFYQLAVHDGLMYDESGKNSWKVQACTVVACLSADVDSCSNMSAPYVNEAEFEVLKLSGLFNTALVLPTARSTKKQQETEFKFTKLELDAKHYTVSVEITDKFSPSGLISLSLHSHNLEHVPVEADVLPPSCPASATVIASSALVCLFSLISFIAIRCQ